MHQMRYRCQVLHVFLFLLLFDQALLEFLIFLHFSEAIVIKFDYGVRDIILIDQINRLINWVVGYVSELYPLRHR
jgi:hypothetical protein